jgi:beta-galactosidase
VSHRARSDRSRLITRRDLLGAGATSGAALALGAPVAQALAKKLPPSVPPVTETYDFNQGWRFGGVYRPGSQDPTYGISRFSRVNLPHTVVPLSWGNWNPSSWERMWIYRKQFHLDAPFDGRVFLDFDGVMTNATVYLNGFQAGQHIGGFLPFTIELTDLLQSGRNDLAVVVDGRLLDVPPLGNVNGAAAIDFLTPAGIYRDVQLRVVPETYVADVFAKPVNVLSSRPSLDLAITVNAAVAVKKPMTLAIEVLDGSRRIATRTLKHKIGRGNNVVRTQLSNLAVSLWSPDSPRLYTVRVTLKGRAVPAHTVNVRTGFRQATFEVGGFFLNGERLQIMGLSRHQMFPYTGMAASARLQARDAQVLKNELNCNMVRCSHYPPSPHFLDACDQVGLMVWEEPPGWDYVGDANFEAIFLQNVRDMVLRDRNRPSVVVWATRLNETQSFPTLYAEARQLAHSLDGTRATSGAIAAPSPPQGLAGWSEDLFAYNDYGSTHPGAVDADARLSPPLTNIPYLVSEAVGAIAGPPNYRWIDPSATLQEQTKLHAEVNQQARSNPAYSGVLAWAGIDYDSLTGGRRMWNHLRTPGVIDIFRVPKPGAAFYQSQVSPLVRPVIIPAFFWDFGSNSPATGPGPGAIFATNCDELQISIDGQLLTTATPDTTDFGNLAFPPVVVDLTVDGSSQPTLSVAGFYQGRQVATLQMSSNPATDRLAIDLEDARIVGDGSDTTRLSFRAIDAFGNHRPYVSGGVSISLRGPAAIVGQNPFPLDQVGGVGGVIIRSEAGRSGTAHVTVAHPTLGSAQATLTVARATGKYL